MKYEDIPKGGYFIANCMVDPPYYNNSLYRKGYDWDLYVALNVRTLKEISVTYPAIDIAFKDIVPLSTEDRFVAYLYEKTIFPNKWIKRLFPDSFNKIAHYLIGKETLPVKPTRLELKINVSRTVKLN